jgi:AcrR family transcriptional regulator
MFMSDQAQASSRGRPRSEASRSAIIAAAAALLRTVGLQRMTVEAVAERSGVGKATIYRWWPSKGMLALDAYLDDMRAKVVPPDTGDGREDFRRHTLAVLKFYGGEDGKVFAQFIAEGQTDTQLAEAFRERFLAQRRATVSAIWQRGVERGDFRDDIDVNTAMDMLFGPIIYRLLAGHQPLTQDFATSLTEAALNGLCPR